MKSTWQALGDRHRHTVMMIAWLLGGIVGYWLGSKVWEPTGLWLLMGGAAHADRHWEISKTFPPLHDRCASTYDGYVLRCRLERDHEERCEAVVQWWRAR